ncbi:MAG: O-antigen ligase family protein, partial [Acidobacteriota bacterium]|nr:O-antigen ligase family protein [Acidobacteriota bacterium]
MKSRIYSIFAVCSFLLLSFVLICHFHIQWLPLACLLLGFLARSMFTSGYLEIFSFLIPVLPACAAIESRGFPPNYLLLPLFFLAGIMPGEWLARRGRPSPPLPRLPRFYPLFLMLLGISFFFVMLRWSNLTLSPLAFFKDTPVAPTGQRLSFAIIFPVVELALFALSPLYFLLLRRSANLQRVVIAFLGGQSLSILFSLVQRLQQWRSPSPVISGLASDATAFGFLSALAILLAWHLGHRFGALKLGAAFAFIALAGILNSTTRVGLLAVALALVLFFATARKKAVPALLVAAFAAALLLTLVAFPKRGGSSLLARLETNIHEAGEAIQTDREGQPFSGSLTAHRDVLWRYAWECLREFPLTGAGTGNFVFWVMAAHRGGYFHHLTANQYFFFTSSLGLFGLAAFLFFGLALFASRRWPEKCLLAAFFLFFLFNDYLWFAEIAMAFWLVAGLGEKTGDASPAPGRAVRALSLAAILAFVFFNIFGFSRLHPKSWAQASLAPYDYGLYYPEGEKGRQFQWSGEKAGIYITLDKNGRNENFRLACGAPLSRLPSKKQTVDIYWRGKFHKRVVFRDHAEDPVAIEDRRHSQGFLEFRVRPAFNRKSMG